MPPVVRRGPYGLSERLPEYIIERVFQDIGIASMCWENPDGAGVFDSDQASALGGRLCHFIADEIAKARFAQALYVGPDYVIPKRPDVPSETWRDRPPLL